MFADDIVIFGGAKKQTLVRLKECSDKTQCESKVLSLRLQGVGIKKVEDLKYMGSGVRSNRGCGYKL